MSTCKAVVVKRLPESVGVGDAQQLFREVILLLEGDRPRLVFDFSEVRQLDSAGIEFLLRCTEEAMKRNGDIKLAAVPPPVAVVLQLTRVDRLFEIFENSSDATESFHHYPLQTLRQAEDLKNAGQSGGTGTLSS